MPTRIPFDKESRIITGQRIQRGLIYLALSLVPYTATDISSQKKKNAKKIAKAVVCSDLLKAAMFGADANWGRVLCAIGYSGAEVDVNNVELTFQSRAGEILVCEKGMGVDFSEEKAKEVLSEDEIVIDIRLGDGFGKATAWGCDLTYDYVKINGDYRT